MTTGCGLRSKRQFAMMCGQLRLRPRAERKRPVGLKTRRPMCGWRSCKPPRDCSPHDPETASVQLYPTIFPAARPLVEDLSCSFSPVRFNAWMHQEGGVA